MIDDATAELIKALRSVAHMIECGERIPWGADTVLMERAADALEGVSSSTLEKTDER